ncbi:hypothetical protein V7654_09915 [Bacillus sp. JJ1609]|uniref:hypothetical protein n=1 Tax=Bacillus sp. JJ1609 TaxID=3122977 RepID=UPI002FFE6B39
MRINFLYTTIMHCDAIIAAPRYTDPAILAADGNPYSTSVTVAQDEKMAEEVETAV